MAGHQTLGWAGGEGRGGDGLAYGQFHPAMESGLVYSWSWPWSWPPVGCLVHLLRLGKERISNGRSFACLFVHFVKDDWEHSNVNRC